jgi:translation initiation factor IF-2
VAAFAEALAPFAGTPARPASAVTAPSTTALSVDDLPAAPAERRSRSVLWLVAVVVALLGASVLVAQLAARRVAAPPAAPVASPPAAVSQPAQAVSPSAPAVSPPVPAAPVRTAPPPSEQSPPAPVAAPSAPVPAPTRPVRKAVPATPKPPAAKPTSAPAPAAPAGVKIDPNNPY